MTDKPTYISDLTAKLLVDVDEIECCGGGNEAGTMREAAGLILRMQAALISRAQPVCQQPKLPVLRTPDDLVKTVKQWKAFARRDDCLARMVPSDLRLILSNLPEDEE